MRAGYACTRLLVDAARCVLFMLLRVLLPVGRVTALLLLTAAHRPGRAADIHATDLSVFRFSCEFRLLVGRGCVEGLMVSNGSQQRIAVYWIEPDVFRESPAFLRYSDFLFTSKRVHYWIHPGPQQRTFLLSDNPGDPLLPRQDSVESIVRSALAIVARMKVPSQGADTPLEVVKFLHGGRGLTEYAYEAVPSETDSNTPPVDADSDVRTLNALPSGRKYSKERQSDGIFVWCAQRTLGGPPAAIVTIKPMTGLQESDALGVFDTNTLGQWTLIPEFYRVYWSFDRAYSELANTMGAHGVACELHDRIESCLKREDLPVQLRRGMHRLALKAALATSDMGRVCRSVRVSVAGLCEDASLGKYRALLELARISGQIGERYPDDPQEWLRPLVAHMARHGAGDVEDCLDRLMPTLEANKWFTFGRLLLDEVRSQGLMEEQALKQAVLRFEATRLVRDGLPPDPCESSPSVREYLARLDANPPSGAIDMNDVRHMLEEGLGKYWGDRDPAMKRVLVEDIIRSVRLIVGDGPFCGNQDKLTTAVARFSEHYVVIYGSTEPINTVLATFLALYFCDISTSEDHSVLIAQFHSQCAAGEAQVNVLLAEAGLGALVGPNDVESVFGLYEQVFREYVDDPLWPTFKFPLTSNEEARLGGTLRLRLMQLKALLDEMALKVRYGGVSPQLRERTVYEISRVAEQLVPEAAFLRKPPYPGVGCHYRGHCGFAAIITGPLYEEGDRPREKFQAMKYFHLGHRLQSVVEQERESTRHAEKEEISK